MRDEQNESVIETLNIKDGLIMSQEQLIEAQDKKITRLDARVECLTKFFKGVMWGCGGEWCDNLDGGDLQDMAEQQGLIVQTTMHEPCGEICACADVMGSDGFPLTCYRYVEWLEKHHEEITTDRTDHPTVHGHGTG